MNAAARLVHQNALSPHLVLTYLLTRRQVIAFVLTFFILLSAISIIYVTHCTRVSNAAYQQLLLNQHKLNIERSQLLLENSTQMVPGRIQSLAEKQLSMTIPDRKSIVFIREK